MESRQLPLISPIGARYSSLTVDSRLVNAFAELGQQQGEVFVYKRPAFKNFQTLPGGAGVARGLFNWKGDIYAVVGATIYKNGVSIGTVAAAGVYSFTACLGGSPKLFLQNGTNAYTVDGTGTLAAVTNINYPAATVSGSQYLDGTVYVFDGNGNIYGSTAAGNDPTTWDPLNKIIAQSEPTAGVHIAKQLVYLLAMKTYFTEVFYDAGNATGSVLGNVQGAKMNFGCVDARTVRDVGGDLLWVANSGEGFYTAVSVSSLKLNVISTPQVERILATGTASNWYGWNARIEGHRLYCVNNSVGNFSLVYDLTSQLWYQWTDIAGNALPYGFSCQGSGSQTLFLHLTNGKLYSLDTATYQDDVDASPFNVQIFTPNYDGGTRRSKTIPWLCMVGDQVNTTVSLSYSDNDYTSFSTPLTVNMNLDQPIITGLGSFTKRAFQISHQANTAFRLKGVEIMVDLGVT